MSKKQYNVNREVNDTFYRYKMPAIIAKVEGQGNGIKTVIVNMVDIARALNREAIYPTKYFGIELGAQTQIDKKNERFIVNGSHDGDKLQDILDGYIKKFVLCQQCENPETKLTVSREDIYETCMACGNKGKLRNMGHGLANFIVRQHKNSKIDNKKSKKNKDVKESKTTTTKNIYKGETVDGKVTNGGVIKGGWEGDDWNSSDSEDESEILMKNLSLKEMKPSDMTSEQKGKAFEEYIQDLVDENLIDDMMKAREKIMQIVLKADYYGVKTKAPIVLFDKLFTSEEFVKSAKKYRGILIYINRNTDDSPDLKAMKYSMSAFEMYIEKFPAMTDKTAALLKFLYDSDILDEAAIIEWGDSKPSKKFISKELCAAMKEKSRKLVEWLKTAETESEDSEEDSDEEVALEFTDQKSAGVVETKPESPSNGAVNGAEDEEDVDDSDIDDI